MIEKRINELIEIINKASYEYYTLDKPSITDQEYDDYYHELEELEKLHPELIKFNSPNFDRLKNKKISIFLNRLSCLQICPYCLIILNFLLNILL